MEFLKRSILWLPVGYAFTDVVASVHRIKGDSMAPTLNPEGTDSDVVLVEKISVRYYMTHDSTDLNFCAVLLPFINQLDHMGGLVLLQIVQVQ